MCSAEGNKKEMDMLRWSTAFDRFTLAVAVTGQMTVGAAIAHKNQCLQVSMEAGLTTPPRGRHLGALYDTVCRKTWAERSTSGDVTFDIEVAAPQLDTAALRTACSLHDEAKKQAPPRKGDGKGKGAKGDMPSTVFCFKCGQQGHYASACPKDAGKKCARCGKKGHTEAECWSKKRRLNAGQPAEQRASAGARTEG